MTKISVCMATFNGEKYIEAQIFSILEQISSGDELIISDDCSTDSTIDIITNMADERIKIVYNINCRNYTKNFESAINHATGDVIFLSDQDDVWFDGKVKKTLEAMNTAQLVVSDAQFVDQDLVLISGSFFSVRGSDQGLINNLYKQRYLGACMAFRREILPKLLPFPVRTMYCTHDLWITILCEMYYSVKIINEPLISYRRHGGNASGGGAKSNNSIMKMIFIRLYTLFHAMQRVLK